MPLLIAVVPALPKDAAVELHVTAIKDDPSRRTSRHMVACGSIECHTVLSADKQSGSLSLSLAVTGASPEITGVRCLTEEVSAVFMKAMKMMDAELVPLCARVFYKCNQSLAWQVVQGMSLNILLSIGKNI